MGASLDGIEAVRKVEGGFLVQEVVLLQQNVCLLTGFGFDQEFARSGRFAVATSPTRRRSSSAMMKGLVVLKDAPSSNESSTYWRSAILYVNCGGADLIDVYSW